MVEEELKLQTTFDPKAVAAGISEVRLRGYLNEVDGNLGRALDLYAWNARMAAEAFALIGHLEVLLRNRLDDALKRAYEEEERGIPWFLQVSFPNSAETTKKIRDVRARNDGDGYPDTRDRVIAGMSLGFWVTLLATHELWPRKLELAFPPGTRRKHVTGLVDSIRQTRNRAAHHDYVKAFDLPGKVKEVLRLANMLSPDYAVWMEQNSEWEEIYRSSPKTDMDTVIVAGREAWNIYEQASVYVCRPGRYFRDVERLGFYENKSIRRQVPRILEIRDNVLWTEESAQELESSDNPNDRKIAKAIRWSQTDAGKQVEGGWDGRDNQFKVFVLTRSRDEHRGNDRHLVLTHDIPHQTIGRGSAFTQRQRYVPSSRLQVARSTDDLALDITSTD